VKRVRVLALAAAIPFCAPGAALAQHVNSDVPRAGMVEVGATATWTGGDDLGTIEAREISNPGVSSNPLTLFRTDAKVKPSVGVEGQIGVYLSRALEIEGTGSFSRPVLSVRLSGDFEGAPDTTAEKTLTNYLIGGAALYHFGRGRLRPFVFGGAAYLRQLDADAVAAQNGMELHAGGGLKYWLGRGRRRSALRLDARISSRNRSAGFDPMRRATLPMVSAGYALLF
jgi:hypothetical protein